MFMWANKSKAQSRFNFNLLSIEFLQLQHPVLYMEIKQLLLYI